MRIHVVSVPNTETTKDFEWDGFTARIRRFTTMLYSLGYDVRLYSGEANDTPCTEHIPIVTRAEQKEWFGHYDWSRDVFHDFDSNLPCYVTMNSRAAAEIRKRADPGDVVGLSFGISQKPIADALPDSKLLFVETGIGYAGVWAPFRIFESHSWQHFLAAREPIDDLRFFDTVIPGCFEIDHFPEGKGDGGYYLFMGRISQRKGPHIAALTCKNIGAKLIVAGQGVVGTNPITTTDGLVLEGDVEYAGHVDAARRAELLGGAIAVFAPTIYLEPFGYVAPEAQMCGTPVISTDWGAFTETVIQGVTGYRCRTLAEFIEAAKNVKRLDRKVIRKSAHERFSTDVVKHKYDRYFRQLATLKDKGWYTVPESR